MVNHGGRSPKTAILAILREGSAPVSGERLGLELQMTRVAVHKHIRSLRQAGYTILSDHGGYRILEEGSPAFSTWEFADTERVTVMDGVTSTMDAAHRRVRDGESGDFVLAALTQNNGRGRLGRTWSSPPGGLWATRVIHPAASALDFQRYVMAAVAGLARVLREAIGLEARVKWPNDVLIDGRKVAGVLGEGSICGDRMVYIALGLGLNVNNAVTGSRCGPGTDGSRGVALRGLTGREEDRRGLLRGWLASSDALIDSSEFRGRDGPGWWNAIMEGRGRQVEVSTGDGRRRGRVSGVDGLGRLILRCGGGGDLRIPAGDVDFAVGAKLVLNGGTNQMS